MKNLFDISGKTAVVTGGSRGIGLMIARGFVENGAKVYISSRKAEVCDRVAEELSQHGTCVSLPFDLGTTEGVEGLAAAVKEREDSLDILVNNAGATWGAPMADFPEDGWDKVVDLNMKSVFFLTKALRPLLKAAGTAEDPGRVINIGSIDGLHVSMLETYSYAAAKAGVHHLTRMMARNMASDHITVNAIAPGPFESKMMAATLAAAGDAIVASNPRGRIGTPEDIAGTSIYLSSRAGAYITGTVIPVDGGIVGTA